MRWEAAMNFCPSVVSIRVLQSDFYPELMEHLTKNTENKRKVQVSQPRKTC